MDKIKPKLLGRIDKAYCYELNAIISPYLAIERGLKEGNCHLFCPTTDCGWELRPGAWHRETDDYIKAWFVTSDIPDGLDFSHENGCPYGNKKRSHTGDGESKIPENKEPEKLEFPFIPGEIRTTHHISRVWPIGGVDRENILQAINGAVGRGADGSIEEVVDAYRFLCNRWIEYLKLKKNGETPNINEYSIKNNRIDMGETVTNYYDGFIDLRDQGKHATNEQHWGTHIFHCRALVQKFYKGIFTLFPVGREFVIHIDPSAASGIKGKDQIYTILNKAYTTTENGTPTGVLLYFWDIQPMTPSGGGRIPIEILKPSDFLRTAIRP